MAQWSQTLFGRGSISMQTLKLLSAFFKVNVQMALAYRADTVINILINLMWLGWELLSLNIIFSNTTTLGGWGQGQLIALLGVFRLVNTLMGADRKSTRLNFSHGYISYAVFCLKKKKK